MQTTGIDGYRDRHDDRDGNTSAYTGSGIESDRAGQPAGNGGAFLVGDTGKIVTGSALSVSGLGGRQRGGGERQQLRGGRPVAGRSLAATTAP